LASVIGYATVQLIPSFDGLEAKANEQLGGPLARVGDSAGRKTGGIFGNGFLTTVGHVMVAAGLYQIGQTIATGIGNGIVTGLKTASFMEQAQQSLTTLLGGASDAAKSMLTDLTNFASHTPFELQGVITGTQQLLGAGAAASSVIPTLTALGDANAAIGGSQDSLNKTLLAWTQLMTRGKIDTQDLYQVSNAGIPIWKELATALNVPVTSIQDLVSSGSLLSSDVLPKLQAQLEKDYGGSMALQAKTLAGAWSNVHDTITQALGQAFEPMAPWLVSILPGAAQTTANAILGISHGIQDLIGFIKSTQSVLGQVFGPAFATVFAQVGQAVAPFVDVIKNSIAGMGPALAQVLPAFTPFATIFKALLPVIPPVAGFLAQIAATAIPLLADALQVAAPIVTQLVTFLGQLGQMLAGVVGRALIAVTPFVEKFITALLKIVTAVSGPLLQVLPQIFNMLGGPFMSVISTLVNTGLNLLIQLFDALAPVVLKLIQAFMPLVQMIMTTLMPAFMSIIQQLLPPLMSLFSALMPIIQALIPPIVSIVTALAQMLIPIIQALMPIVSAVINFIVGIIQPIVTIIKGVIDVISGVLTGNWSQAWNGIKEIFSGIWNLILNILSGAWNIIVSIFNAIGPTLVAIWNTGWSIIGSAISGAWNVIVGFFQNGVDTAVGVVRGIGAKIGAAVSGAWNWLVSMAQDMWNGFVKTWNRVVSGIADIVLAPFKGAISAVKALLGIHSPSRVMGEIAGNVADGFILGLNRRSDDIADAYGVFGAQQVYGPNVAPADGGIAGAFGAGSASGLAPVNVDSATVLDLIQQVADGRISLFAKAQSRSMKAGSLY
jgi:tape measure domain-containing protein